MILLNNKTQILIVILVKMVYANMDSKDGGKNSFTKLLKNIVDVNEKRVVAMKELSNLQDFIYTTNSLSKIHDFEFDEDSTENLRDRHATLTLISMRKKVNISLRRTYKKQPYNSHSRNSQYITDKNKKNGNKHINMNSNRYKLNVYLNRDLIDEEIKSSETREERAKDDNYNKNIGKKYTKLKITKENKQNDYKDWIKNINYRRSKCDTKESKLCRRACVNAHRNGCLIYKCTRRAKKAFSKECKQSCRDMFLVGQYSDSEED